MQEKVREYIKEYYKDKEITNIELNLLNRTKLTINKKVVNLADLLKFCTSYLPEDCKYSERLYNIIFDIYTRPICPTCNINTCNFKDYYNGYNITCSVKCSKNNEINKEKYKNTCIERYGVEHYSQTEEFKNKYKQTCLQNHGVENAFQNKEVQEKYKKTCLIKYGATHPFQNKEVQDKYKKTLLKNYGIRHPLQSKEIQEKAKQTILNNYSVEHYSQTEEFKNKYKETCLNNYGVENTFQITVVKDNIKLKIKNNKFNELLINSKRLNNCTPLFNIEEYKQNNVNTNYKFKWKCNICDTVFYDDISNGTSPVCPVCYKKYGSNLQKEIYEFIYNYTDNIRINDRSAGFEIDLYLKDYNIGIEVNGNYWHSDLRGKDKYYHLNKTLECAKNNISIMHIFEDDWLYRKDIVKNIILDKLNLITNTVDNLSIYKINQDIAAEFLNNNCIHGNIDIKDNTNIIHYGLCDLNNIYYLISIDLTNSKIVRYCSKLNYKISNDDISKLISHICKENDLTNLTVYCDLRYDSGELFKSIGFNYLKFKHPTYDFISKKNYLTRIDKENLIFENYDDKLSIWYNAINNNYDRIWNCGFLIYNL